MKRKHLEIPIGSLKDVHPSLKDVTQIQRLYHKPAEKDKAYCLLFVRAVAQVA